MKFQVFGIGSASPQLDIHPSSFLVKLPNEYILIDCGEGTQYRLLENKIKHTKIRTICISHLHGDHYFGLVGLLSSLSLNRRTEPLRIIGPPALQQIIEMQLMNSGSKMSFEITFIHTDAAKSEMLLDNAVFSIRTIPLTHRVPCTGFLIEEKQESRHLLAEKLPANFPIPYIKMLKNGKDVIDELTGKVYKFEEYTREGEPSKKLAYCSDTAYRPDIIPIIKNANLIYHEATFTDELLERAAKTQHSTASQAAEIAKEANAKKLVIGHFSSRYKTFETHLAEAQAVFSDTFLAEEGLIYEVE